MDQPLKARPDSSARIRKVGKEVMVVSLIAMFMTVVGLVQVGNPPMGEIGNFIHDASIYILPLCALGLATGIGLMRAWRWARISMLFFGAVLALFCALPALLFLAMPRGAIGWGETLGLRAVGLLFLIPPGFVVKRHLYFLSDEAKAYFHATQRGPTASV